MNNKGVGAVFFLISAILISARYISAAVFMSNVASWNSELFRSGLHYVGLPLLIASIVSLAAGIAFLASGICQDRRDQKKK